MKSCLKDRSKKIELIINQELIGIKKRKDISEDEKVSKVILIFSSSCALVAIQPIPFADIFLLTPIQIFMGKEIASIRGYSVTKVEIIDLIKKISGVISLGLFAQYTVIGLYKIGLPVLGGFMTIPLVYGLTYAIGKTIDYCLVQEKTGRGVDMKDISEYAKKVFKEGKKLGKAKVKDISEYAKKVFKKGKKLGKEKWKDT